MVDRVRFHGNFHKTHGFIQANQSIRGYSSKIVSLDNRYIGDRFNGTFCDNLDGKFFNKFTFPFEMGAWDIATPGCLAINASFDINAIWVAVSVGSVKQNSYFAVWCRVEMTNT